MGARENRQKKGVRKIGEDTMGGGSFLTSREVEGN